MITLAQWHHDRKHENDFSWCWQCQRIQNICNRKIRFTTRDEAKEWCADLNEMRQYKNPVVPYRCIVCEQWHMTTAKKKGQKHRAERARRDWLIAERTLNQLTLAKASRYPRLRGPIASAAALFRALVEVKNGTEPPGGDRDPA